MNMVRRTTAGILSMAMLLTAASCSTGKKDGSNGDKNESSDTKVIKNSYSAIEIDADVPLEYIQNITPIADTGNLLIKGGTGNGKNAMYITDMEFLSLTPIELPVSDEAAEYYFTPTVTPSGTIYAVTTITSYGDIELPDYEDPDFDYENYDWDAMYEAAVTEYKLFTIDSTGSVTGECELSGIEKYNTDSDRGFYMGDIFACGENLIMRISTDHEIIVQIGTDGVIGDELDVGDDSYFYITSNDRDGNLAFLTWDNGNNVIKMLDANTLKLTDESFEVPEGTVSNINKLITGDDKYKFYISGSSALFGLTYDGYLDEIVNWLDSDLNGDTIGCVVPLGNEEFFIHENDWNSNKNNFYRITKRDASEFESVDVVTIATDSGRYDLLEMVKDFNKSHSDVRVRLLDYSSYYQWDDDGNALNSPESQLKMDIAAGKCPDIIMMYNSSLINNLGRKGALVDLYDFLGTEGTPDKDGFVPGVLKAGEVNGKLCAISPTFSLMTMAVKGKHYDKPTMSISDMIELYDSKNMDLFQYEYDHQGIFYTFMSGGDYIDDKNAVCHFDSPEFIKLLEFANRPEFEMNEDDEMGKYDDDNYWEQMQLAYRNDKALLKTVYISDPREWKQTQYFDMSEDMNIVGMPSLNGSTTYLRPDSYYAIMGSASNKEACWKFISQTLTEDYQTSDTLYDLPSLKSAFDKAVSESKEDPYYIDYETGKKVTYKNTVYISEGNEIEIPNLSDEDAKAFVELVNSAEPQAYSYNDAVNSIVTEEADAYFKGARSAKETAELIQNRVSILISEQS